jgi:hypothetical protein
VRNGADADPEAKVLLRKAFASCRTPLSIVGVEVSMEM